MSIRCPRPASRRVPSDAAARPDPGTVGAPRCDRRAARPIPDRAIHASPPARPPGPRDLAGSPAARAEGRGWQEQREACAAPRPAIPPVDPAGARLPAQARSRRCRPRQRPSAPAAGAGRSGLQPARSPGWVPAVTGTGGRDRRSAPSLPKPPARKARSCATRGRGCECDERAQMAKLRRPAGTGNPLTNRYHRAQQSTK